MNDTTTTLAIGHRTIPLDPPRPPRKPDMLLWIDTETTGLDPYQCELLEVGMQVTDMTGKHPHDSLHLIVHPDNIRNWANHPELLKAYEMHLANGLMLASAEGLHHRKLDLTTLRLTDQAIGRDPYQNHAGAHRVQDCIHRDINDYTAYLDIMRAGHQGIQS